MNTFGRREGAGKRGGVKGTREGMNHRIGRKGKGRESEKEELEG